VPAAEPIDDRTLERMRGLLAEWDLTNDQRAVFLHCYALMTDNMLRSLNGGGFLDSTWVRALLDRFAEYYFTALDA
jgi:hypothetical protein